MPKFDVCIGANTRMYFNVTVEAETPEEAARLAAKTFVDDPAAADLQQDQSYELADNDAQICVLDAERVDRSEKRVEIAQFFTNAGDPVDD